MTAAAAPDTALRPGKGWAWALVLFGAGSIVAGVVAALYPGITLLVVSLIFGINIIVMSIADLVESVIDRDADTASRVLSAMLGVLGLIAGIIVLRHPGHSLAAIILAIGLYLVVAGVVRAFRALATLSQDRARRAMVGIVELTVGVIILSVPGIGLATLALFAAAGMIARGIGAVWLGLQLRTAAA